MLGHREHFNNYEDRKKRASNGGPRRTAQINCATLIMADMGQMGTARADWLYLSHKGEVAVLACSLGAFRLPCEGKSGLLRGFMSLIFPHGGRKTGQRKFALCRQ